MFENTWVSNPVCMSNRSTIMTGRMPSAHGGVLNDRSLDWGANTFVKGFRKSGYRTGLIGKSHPEHGMSKSVIVASPGEPSGYLPFPAGWDEAEDYERYLDSLPHAPDDLYGSYHIELSLDHGARATDHHLLWAMKKGAIGEDLLIDMDGDCPGTDRSTHSRRIYRPPYDEAEHSTTLVAERTFSFVEKAKLQGKPWLSSCSFPDAHHPMTPPASGLICTSLKI